jgi:hypothetical protein
MPSRLWRLRFVHRAGRYSTFCHLDSSGRLIRQAGFDLRRDRMLFLGAGVEVRDPRGCWSSMAARKTRLMRVW